MQVDHLLVGVFSPHAVLRVCPGRKWEYRCHLFGVAGHSIGRRPEGLDLGSLGFRIDMATIEARVSRPWPTSSPGSFKAG